MFAGNVFGCGFIIDAASIGSVELCECTILLIACSSSLDITGTDPGVLFRVWRRCVRGVILSRLLAVGFLDLIMGGAFVIRSIVVIGVSSITLCCCSRSSSLTLCSSLFVAGGISILVICDWRFLIHVRPCGVSAASLVSSASSSVSARRCWIFVKFGSWQCCGYTSVDPEILYAWVSGM